MTDTSSQIRVGIIGCGEVTQVVHLPTLSLLPHLFKVTAICDPSQEAITHVKSKFNISKAFLSSSELVNQEDVDLVLICSPDEFHLQNVVESCKAKKHVLVEKPMALTRSAVKEIIKARDENGVTVSVGYMRRFATAFQTFKELINEKESGKIQHVVVKDIVGPNAFFVNQSGTYPQKFISDIPSQLSETKTSNGNAMAQEFLGSEKAKTQRMVSIYRLLGSLGSHDLSLMRETLGKTPDKCLGAFANSEGDFINAHFVVGKDGEKDSYAVQYMTGIHEVGFFDASIEVICQRRVIKIQYDTPYIKALPIKIQVRENLPNGEFQEREVRSTFKDPYTSEWEELHQSLKNGKGLKTSVEDAEQDLNVFEMILEKIA